MTQDKDARIAELFRSAPARGERQFARAAIRALGRKA